MSEQPYAWLHYHDDLVERQLSFRPLSEADVSRGWTQEPLYSAVRIAALEAENVRLKDTLWEAREGILKGFGMGRNQLLMGIDRVLRGHKPAAPAPAPEAGK